MPNGLFNWNYKDIDRFLREHYFELVNIEGSHYFYQGRVDGSDRVVCVLRHTSKSILPKTLESIIHKSGIPKDIWKKWGSGKGAHYLGAQNHSQL